MFCNKCGKENKDGAKFCIQCGNILSSNDSKLKETNYSKVNINAPKKSFIIFATVVVLVIIAAIKIASLNFGVKNVDTKNHEMVVNMQMPIVETNAYIYYTSDGGLYRADKATRSSSRVSKNDFEIITASSNTVYLQADGYCYKISDKDKKPEKYFELCMYGGNTYFDGKYNYYVDGSGVLIKCLNSDKFYDYSVQVNEGLDDEDEESVHSVKYYKDYAYMIITSRDHDEDENRLARMSLKTGKIEELYDDEAVYDYGITNSKIVCQLLDGGFVVLSLKGKVEEEYFEYEGDRYGNFFCGDGYVYYMDDGDLNRLNIETGDSEELDADEYYYTCLPCGLAYTTENKLVLSDYECDEIATFRP